MSLLAALLSVLAVIATLFSVLCLTTSSNVIHEILGFIIALIAALFLCTASVVQTVWVVGRKIEDLQVETDE